MKKHTQEELTNLLTTDKDELTRICAEVCYGWQSSVDMYGPHFVKMMDKRAGLKIRGFQPLDDTEKGRSQAFELAVKFNCSPNRSTNKKLFFVWNENIKVVHNEDPQAAIVIAAILTVQQENNDE